MLLLSCSLVCVLYPRFRIGHFVQPVLQHQNCSTIFIQCERGSLVAFTESTSSASFIGHGLQKEENREGWQIYTYSQGQVVVITMNCQAPYLINPSGRISKGLRGFKFPLCFQNPCRLVSCQHGWPIAHCPCRITWWTFGSLSNAHGPTG